VLSWLSLRPAQSGGRGSFNAAKSLSTEMAENELWKELLSPASLKQGWHLARNDAKSNFFDAPFYTDTFTIAFEQNIHEISRRLATATYRPAAITFIDVPKSTLAIRPGSLPEIEDRVVLQTIVKLLAPKVDSELPDSVYSYRLKAAPTSQSIFKESDVLDIPYLKKKTISQHFDPFDPWYAVWPEFDQASKTSFVQDGYKYLVATDIAAYFENIQLPLLRDTLLSIFPTEQKIINLLITFFEAWCPYTDQHRTFHRGIPQGTQIASFFGNLFLLPLDRAMTAFSANDDARYFRYMDDLRLFTKDYTTARRALLLMDRTIRSVHLNTQSAKTEILAEHPNQEITAKLIDMRMDDVNLVLDIIKEKKNTLTKSQQKILSQKLSEIAKKKPFASSETKIFGVHRPLRGLTFRTFRRWLTAHSMLRGTGYVNVLVREMQRNPDYKLTRKLVAVVRHRPNVSGFALKLLEFVESDLNLFPHQHAEILWACRYTSKVSPKIIEHCKSVTLDPNAYFYVRSSAAMLLSRTVLEKAFLDKCRAEFHACNDVNVRTALAILLMQSTGKLAAPTLHTLVFNPNERIRKIGKLFREVRYDIKEAKNRLKFIFSSKDDWVLCDNMGVLFSIALSDRPEILKDVIKRATSASATSPRLQLRATLKEVAKRANVQLSNLSKSEAPA
jgi:hypothetical protein